MGVNRLTPLETEMLRMLCELLDFLDQRHVSYPAYTEMKGKLTQMIRKVDNIASGCPTGAHSYIETCERKHRKVA